MPTISWAQMPAWAAEREDMMDAIVRQSAQEVIAVAQKPKAKGGPMPVVSGNLRGSLISQLHGGTSLTGPESYVLAVAGMEAGDVASFEWDAEYAEAVNNGRDGRAGARFADTAALQWGAIVDDVIRRVGWAN